MRDPDLEFLAEFARKGLDALASDLRLPEEGDRENLYDALSRARQQIFYDLQRQFGSIAMREYQAYALHSILTEFARSVGSAVNARRSVEALDAASVLNRTMLGAMVAGAKIAREDPQGGVGLERTFGGALETIANPDRNEPPEPVG